MLHTQQRHNDVKSLLIDYLDSKNCPLSDPYQEAEVCRVLAKSYTKLGQPGEANDLLARAWTSLKNAQLQFSQTAHHLLLDRAQIQWTMGRMSACEHLLHQVLTIATRQISAPDIDLSYIIYLLGKVYLRQGKTESLIALERQYPDYFECYRWTS